MKPNTSMVQFSHSTGSNTRRCITASSRTYAVNGPGRVRIGSRGCSVESCGDDSNGFNTWCERLMRTAPHRRVAHPAQARLDDSQSKHRALRPFEQPALLIDHASGAVAKTQKAPKCR